MEYWKAHYKTSENSVVDASSSRFLLGEPSSSAGSLGSLTAEAGIWHAVVTQSAQAHGDNLVSRLWCSIRNRSVGVLYMCVRARV